MFILFLRSFKRQEHQPIHVDVMSRPLLHLFGKLVYNGWAISLGGAASNFAYERRAFHVITPHCLKGLQQAGSFSTSKCTPIAFQNTNYFKNKMSLYCVSNSNSVTEMFFLEILM